jgi:hypothetical protein
MRKRDLLEHLTIGRRVAEEESDELASYFVETNQWRKMLAGDVDIVFGPKGSGKSAIYATLLDRSRQLLDKQVVLVSAENPRGAPAFRDLVANPPTSEAEFVSLWKLFALYCSARPWSSTRSRARRPDRCGRPCTTPACCRAGWSCCARSSEPPGSTRAGSCTPRRSRPP